MAGANFQIQLGSYSGTIAIGTPVTLGSNIGSASASSVAVTTTNTVPTNGLIVVGVFAGFGAAQTITGVNDGSAYTRAVTNAYDGTSQTVLDIWYRIASSGLASSSTITASFSAASSGGNNRPLINAAYVTGVITSSTLDKAVSTSFTNNTTAYASGSSGVLSQANEIAFGFMGNFNASATHTEGSGFTNINTNTQGATAWWMSRLSYQTVSATTALNYQPSTSTNTYGKAGIVTFKGN